MFAEIARFELRYHLRQPLFWLAMALFFLMTFGAVTTDTVQIGGAIGNVDRNAPFVIQQILLIMSAIGVFVGTAFVANAVVRDQEHATHEMFFTTPIRKADYLLGRFAGAFAVAVLIYLAVVLALVVGSWMPWLDPEQIGPFRLAPYLHAMAFIVVPNVFLLSAIFFGLATLTRSMMGTYVGLVGFFVGFAIAQTVLTELEHEGVAALVDPFGGGAFALATKYWTTAERNALLVPIDGPMLTNRLLWLGVAVAVLGLTYARFSFTASGRKRRRREEERQAAEPTVAEEAGLEVVGAAPGRLPRPPRRFSVGTSLTQLLHQTGLEVKGVVGSRAFAIILAMGVLNLVGNATVLGAFFGTPVHPVTHLMLGVVESGFVVFAVIILTFYAGELVWRERQTKLDEVHDALPAPSWVFWGSKMVALVAVLAGVLLTAAVTSMGIQTYHGYTNYEPGLYAGGLGLRVGLPFLLVAVLALFVQVLTNHKYLGFLVMVLYFVGGPVLAALDFDHNLYRFAASPAAPYSDMNGFGHFVLPSLAFLAYWGFVALGLLALGHLLWVRGKETSVRTRLRLARARLRRPVGTVLAVAGVGAVGLGGWIFYNTNVLNAYVPGDLAEERAVRWEKEYKKYERAPKPRVVAARVEVDLFPEERSADLRGRYRMVNGTGSPLDSLHLVVDPDVETRSLVVPGATLDFEDGELGYRIYRFEEPLQPGEEIEVTWDVAVRHVGFVNHGSDTRLVHNGTFFNSGDYVPQPGYSRGRELQDPSERRKHGLPPVQRMRDLDDPGGRDATYITDAADWIDFETVVSTSVDQVALAPGYLEREWTEGDRRYFHYTMDAPILPFWSYLSARWEVRRDRWKDVDITVHHHPEHGYNVDRMIEGVKRSLDYFTREFGPYQHRQVRIVEFPGYATFAQAFPNTIPFSESIGFIARLDDPDDIDYVFYVTAHEVAHQWWAHQVIGADVQGATVLSETLAQYSALMVMEKEYGPETMRRFLKYELDRYLRGRGGELIEELPLLRVENQGYVHYRKGSVVMYALRDLVGEAPLNAAIRAFLEEWRFRGPPYPTSRDLLAHLEAAVPDEHRQALSDLFERITLWELAAAGATAEPAGDGKWRVRLEFEAAKTYADGEGAETPAPLDEWVDVAVFGARGEGDPPEGEVLLLEKRRVRSSEGVVELVVEGEPVQAGIDPFNKLIDRNPENNLVDVERGEEGRGDRGRVSGDGGGGRGQVSGGG